MVHIKETGYLHKCVGLLRTVIEVNLLRPNKDQQASKYFTPSSNVHADYLHRNV